jgi:hypothetical protein
MTATVQADVSGFEDLASQLLSKRDSKPLPEAKLERADIPSKEERSEADVRRSSFRKGDQTFDIDDDAEIEFMADKSPVKMKLAELKDRAAGDVAIKNRLHSLAEEKKKVQGTLKEFGKIAQKDPLKALEYISKQVKEAGTEFEYENYLSALADQAEKLARMDDKERRAHQAEKRLEEVEGDLSQKQLEDLVRQQAQASSQALGITESQFNQAAQMVLNNPVLMETIETDQDFFGTVEEMVTKAKHQKRVESAISRVDPSEVTNSDLVIELADIVEELLPDGTDADIQDVVAEVLKPKVKSRVEARLSEKQRNSMPMEHMRAQGASDFQLLVEQLKERGQNKRR